MTDIDLKELRRLADVCGQRGSDVVPVKLWELRALLDRVERAEADSPTPEMCEAGAEVLYGHTKAEAITWAKLDKFEWREEQSKLVYEAMRNARAAQKGK